jgi:hypothetical protein
MSRPSAMVEFGTVALGLLGARKARQATTEERLPKNYGD